MKIQHIRSNGLKAGTHALIALCAFGAGAFAAPVAASAAETSAASASLAGLDLSTPEGVAQARERVHQAARLACARVAHQDDDMSHQTNYVRCIEVTLAAALPKLDRLAKLDSKLVVAEK